MRCTEYPVHNRGKGFPRGLSLYTRLLVSCCSEEKWLSVKSRRNLRLTADSRAGHEAGTEQPENEPVTSTRPESQHPVPTQAQTHHLIKRISVFASLMYKILGYLGRR